MVGKCTSKKEKWKGGVLYSDGNIYCAPYNMDNVLIIKTNHIRAEGQQLLKSNASLTEFNKYINSYQFEQIYVTQKVFYDRLVSYRNNLIVETAKLALESFASRRESKDESDAESSKMRELTPANVPSIKERKDESKLNEFLFNSFLKQLFPRKIRNFAIFSIIVSNHSILFILLSFLNFLDSFPGICNPSVYCDR